MADRLHRRSIKQLSFVGCTMGDNWISYCFHKINLLALSAVVVLMGCGEAKNGDDLHLSDDGSDGSVLVRFFQDDSIYEEEMAFKSVNGEAIFEGDLNLGDIDQLSSKPLNFVLPSVQSGALDFEQFRDGQSIAFGVQEGLLLVYDPKNPNLSIPIEYYVEKSALSGRDLDQFNTDSLKGASSSDALSSSMCRFFGICHTPRRQPSWGSPRVQRTTEGTSYRFTGYGDSVNSKGITARTCRKPPGHPYFRCTYI